MDANEMLRQRGMRPLPHITTIEKLTDAVQAAGMMCTQAPYIVGQEWRLHVQIDREVELKNIQAGDFKLHPSGIVHSHRVVLSIPIEKAVTVGFEALVGHLMTMREIVQTLLG